MFFSMNSYIILSCIREVFTSYNKIYNIYIIKDIEDVFGYGEEILEYRHLLNSDYIMYFYEPLPKVFIDDTGNHIYGWIWGRMEDGTMERVLCVFKEIPKKIKTKYGFQIGLLLKCGKCGFSIIDMELA